ncbi:MAG: S1 RNA-binding domain-containing protein [Lachnospiraceae bacterium]|jgi:small subunit ribosomal protein S1|nr:S1 RNA-binding domain-containing protein [Lachnospiraceae bacterium]MCI9099772.1 S1 RNA-binding domain-containing protein [Lachnospiraceae bacterium]MCI9357678.1 S1 RNA-binding domain-containing protein [Lachnospiraceae bacterium]
MSETMKDYEKELEVSYQEMEEKQDLFASMSEEEQAVWEELKQMKDDKTEVEVKIKEIVKGGAVAFVNEVRGFIPASKLSLTYVEDLNEFQGQHIKVRVFEIDVENKRLILSAKEILREAQEAKKQEELAKIQVGTVVKGVVDSIKPYGAFVKLENGLSGLVHISQISNRRLKTVQEVLSMGDEVTAKITKIQDGKLSLSIKALSDGSDSEEQVTDYEIPKSQELTTSLGSLFANIKLDD